MKAINFDALYQSLNPAQKEAVDTIEGPVMVIAGPGTGKTQILSARILNILDKTDTKPEEILCLTYTEAGVAAMKQRLGLFMGADAYKVNIYTFHGLCNRVIQEFPEKFSRRQLRVMDEIEKIEILNQIIQKIPADSPIKNYMDDPGILRKQLINVFNLMQDEGYTAEEFAEWVRTVSDTDYFIQAFPDLVYKRKGKNGEQPGDIKKSDYEALTGAWKKLQNASTLFQQYRDLKKEAGVYEFRDMIEWVNSAFISDTDLLLHFQEQFQYILVDEYQDTSGLQNQILQSLISFWDENPNCFVVGDDDQSIYAFQGARVDNMLGFENKFKHHLRTIVLTYNYRSTQPILDAARLLILNNNDRLEHRIEGLTKVLISAGENNIENAVPVEIKAYRNRFHEAAAIALEIKEIHEQQGIPWNHFVAIYPKHRLAQDLVDVFREENIPFVLSKEIDILQEPLIRELLQWLEYLAEELEMAHKGEHFLYPILHSPLYKISPFEVARISADIYKLGKGDNPKYWREYLADILSKPTQSDLFQVPPSEALKQLWTEVEKWLKEASMLNVPQLIEKIIAGGGFLSYAMQNNEREWNLEVLRTFLDFAVACNEKVPFVRLQAFLDNTNTMINNAISLPLVKIFGDDTAGVVLSSAHGSKGLEFEHVYIIGADQGNWEKDNSSSLPFSTSKLFGALNMKLQNQSSKEDNFEERRRLFYVAMTRAKKTLSISYCNQKADAGAKTLIPSQFIAEIKGAEGTAESSIPNEKLAAIQLKILQASEKPVLKVENTDWLRKKTENFKFSPSTLYMLFECGLKFYFQRIVRVPSAPNAAAGYGSAMHNTLNRFVNMGTAQVGGKWISAEELVTIFDQEMYKLRSNFNEVSYKTRLQQGKDLLPQYYKARIDDFKQNNAVITERWLETSIHSATVGGYIDKMVFNGNDVTIVDYKSGNPKNAETYFKPPSEKAIAEEKLPPKYWFQVGIYHLVVNGQNTKNWRAAMGLIDLLDKNEAGEFKQLKQTYTKEELDLLSNYVRLGKEKLDNMDFLEGCGKCEWCEFAKQTGQVVVLPIDGDGSE